jgi:hypothetical protein
MGWKASGVPGAIGQKPQEDRGNSRSGVHHADAPEDTSSSVERVAELPAPDVRGVRASLRHSIFTPSSRTLQTTLIQLPPAS